MTTPLLTALQAAWPQHLLGCQAHRGQDTVLVKRDGLLKVMQWLRDDAAARCDVLMDLSAVDYLKFGRVQRSAPTLATPAPLPYYMDAKPDSEPWERGVSDEEYRFDVVYHVYSTTHNHRLRLRVPLTSADPTIASLTGLWRSANWFEREVWDMFGIVFTGHPNLKRILMYEEFVGHPLRKDYPVRRRQPLIPPRA